MKKEGGLTDKGVEGGRLPQERKIRGNTRYGSVRSDQPYKPSRYQEVDSLMQEIEIKGVSLKNHSYDTAMYTL